MRNKVILAVLVVLITTEALVVCGGFTEEELLENNDSSNGIEVNLQSREMKYMKQEKNRYTHYSFKPPPPEEGAKMARYIVHNSEWASLGSISLLPKIKGYPFTDVISISDGPLLNSSGVPYLYMTPIDQSAINIERDNRCSLSLTLAQSNYCKENHFDPEDPRCAHVVLTGNMEEVKKGTNDEEFARNALFSRHPAMKHWPKDHKFFFAKLKIKSVCLLDYFGGPKYINIDDYFHVTI